MIPSYLNLSRVGLLFSQRLTILLLLFFLCPACNLATGSNTGAQSDFITDNTDSTLHLSGCLAFTTQKQALQAISDQSLGTDKPIAAQSGLVKKQTANPSQDCPNSQEYHLVAYQFQLGRSVPSDLILLLQLQDWRGSMRVYLNNNYLTEGGVLESGLPGDRQNATTPPEIAVNMSSQYLQAGWNTVELLFKNTTYPIARTGRIRIWHSNQYYKQRIIQKMQVAALAGMFCIASLFNLFFWLYQKHRLTHLYSSLIAGLVALHLTPELYFQPGDQVMSIAWLRMEAVVLLLALPCFLYLFYHRLYPNLFRKQSSQSRKQFWLYKWFWYYSTCLGGLLGLLVIALPIRISLPFLQAVFWVYTMPHFLVTILLLARAVTLQQTASLVSLIASLLLIAALIMDGLVYSQEFIIQSGYTMWAMLVFTLNFIMILALNRYRTHLDSRTSRRLLQDSHRKLKEHDQQKTRFMLTSSQELTAPLKNLSRQIIDLLNRSEYTLPQVVRSSLMNLVEQSRILLGRFERVRLLFDQQAIEESEFEEIRLNDLLDYFILVAQRKHPFVQIQLHISANPLIWGHRKLLLGCLEELLEYSVHQSQSNPIQIFSWQRDADLWLLWKAPFLKSSFPDPNFHILAASEPQIRQSSKGLGLSLVWRIAEIHGKAPELSAQGGLLFRFTIKDRSKPIESPDATILQHIAFLYRFGHLAQARRELLQLIRPDWRMRLRCYWNPADTITTVLDQYDVPYT